MATGFKKATVNASDVPATQTNFPVYVDLSRLGITTQAEADSVRVYADVDKTTEWARDIVDVAEMHVKVPSLTSTVEIFVDWDGVSADYATTATYGAQAVWADYEAVWHMSGANASTAKKLDSTGNGWNWTEVNTPQTATADQWGGSDTAYSMFGLDGQTSNTSSYDWLYAGSMTSTIASSDCTFSIWLKPNNSPTTIVQHFLREEWNGGTGKSNIGFTWYTDDTINFGYATFTGNATYSSPATSNSGTINSWNYAVGRRQATDYYPSVSLNNGTKVVGTTGASTSLGTGNNNGMLLNARRNSTYSSAYRYMDGQFGEARIRLSELSDNWVTAEYNNQSDEATFWGTWSEAVASSSIKSVNGLAQASVKEVNGLAIASVKSISGLSNVS